MANLMINSAIRVVAGPENYFSYSGSLEQITAFFTSEQLKNAFWLYGKRAFEATRSYLPEGVFDSHAKHTSFDGHCSAPEVNKLASAAGNDRSVVIGVGGGRVLDTAKSLARRLEIPFVAIPTIAATCAAWTPLSVWYDTQGYALGYEIFNDANHLVLVEPEIILRAPKEYLLAGIGDTLAKWYEAAVLSPVPEQLPLTVRLGLDAARTIRDVLIQQSDAALQQHDAQFNGKDFSDVIDAIIAGGGLVGGLGERYTRIAAAHAIHNGLTVLPQTNRFLHGTKVAYGILVQAALLGDNNTLERLVKLFRQFNLPTSLHDLDIDINNENDINKFIQHTLRPEESIHLLAEPMTPEKLYIALRTIEKHVNEG